LISIYCKHINNKFAFAYSLLVANHILPRSTLGLSTCAQSNIVMVLGEIEVDRCPVD
jgi:uncharacterized protein YjfI (DUF2170 family)